MTSRERSTGAGLSHDPVAGKIKFLLTLDPASTERSLFGRLEKRPYGQ